MTDTARIQSFSDFWLYYIGEHRHPVCRMMHFVGTGGFLVILSLCLMANPVRMGSCLLGGIIVGVLARRIEAHRKAGREVIAIAVLWVIGSPWVFAGIFWAYLWAWVGHFKIELNRPATFQYPLWSLFGDFKMVSLMLRGQLWSGEPTITG